MKIKENNGQATPTNMRATLTTTFLICLDGRTTTEGDLNSTHLKFYCSAMHTPSVGEVCEYPEVSSFHFNTYLVLELVLVPASCSIYKIQKNERSCHGDNIEFASTKCHGKYSQCPAFDIKQSPTGRSLEDRQSKSHGENNI